MENDHVLEAEARLYNPPNASPPMYPRNHQEHLGHDAVKVAYGAIEITEDEDTPLLSRSLNSAGRSISEEPNDRPPPPLWSGERDFDGIPWWKRPSVRRNTICAKERPY